MLKRRRKIIFFLLVMMMSFSITQNLQIMKATNNMSLLSSKVHNNHTEFLTFSPSLVERHSVTSYITIPLVGMSTFINIGNNWDKSKIEYTSSNPDVAFADKERILATGVGTAIVQILYENQAQVVHVTVSDKLSDSLLQNAEEEFTMASVKSSETQIRESYIVKATDMVYVNWRPTNNLTGWRGQYTFNANTWYSGIPYSQTYYQRDKNEFLSDLANSSDFYTTYYNGSIAMPRYGNDCSAFLAICWGITYAGSNRYNTTKFWNDYTALAGGFSSLGKGDGLVSTSDGHAFICSINHVSDSYLVAYEQTPPKATMSIWTYSQLQSRGYKPITNIG